MHFGGIYAGGWLSFGTARVKKADFWLYDCFCKIFWNKLILACINVLNSCN